MEVGACSENAIRSSLGLSIRGQELRFVHRRPDPKSANAGQLILTRIPLGADGPQLSRAREEKVTDSENLGSDVHILEPPGGPLSVLHYSNFGYYFLESAAGDQG